MDAMRVDRARSGELCSSSRSSASSGALRRLHSLPNDRTRVTMGALHRRDSFSAVLAVALSEYDTAVEAETELLPRGGSHPDVFSSEYSKQVASLQTLERLKGDLHSALLDLDEPDTEDGFSVDDWHKLNAARQQYTHEQAVLDREEAAERERRKQERAVKRAARKAQAEAAAAGPSTTANSPSTPPAPRRAESLPTMSTGARATARSRSRANKAWGRPAVAETAQPSQASKSNKRGYPPKHDYNSISSHELLTQQEEVELSKKVQDFLLLEKTFQKMEEEFGGKPSMSQWAKRFGQDEQAFIKRLETGLAARSRMLTCNQRLVVSIARKYSNKGMEMMDLVQEGMVGLLRGVEKFDHTKGFKFSTYATWWIRQSISRSVTELSRLIRLPAHLNEMIGKILKTEREFLLAHGRMPKEEELSKLMDVPVSRIRMVKQASTSPRSIHETLKKGADAGETEVGEMIEDPSFDDMDAHIIENSMHRDVNAVLNTLSPREHGIIRMRYGLDDGQPKTLEEIGIAFHVTRERIRQIENKALANLKNPSRNSTLNTYVDGEAQSLLGSPGWKLGVQRDSSQ